VFDDGVGMSRQDVLERWLVIGTESKVQDFDTPQTALFGLPLRTRQGEKGIGRLSVAFLSPATILVTKRENGKFVCVIVDWRLFENPFLALEDIKLPVDEFEGPEQLVAGLPGMLKTLLLNLEGGQGERAERLASAWQRYTSFETVAGTAVTADAIRKSWQSMPLSRRHLEEWLVFVGLAAHGTAMFMIELNHELGVWVRPGQADDEVDVVKDRLRQTLTNFTDPYASDRPDFDYEVFLHNRNGDQRVIGTADVFGLDSLQDLEHRIEGKFDERGTFSGRIVAFGQDLGVKTYRPKRPLSNRGRDKLGPFSFVLGSYEVDERRSTHDSQQHAFLESQAEKFAGIFVFRDGLRVMPYGRPDADFLGLEERRSKHAGRYFFAHRRSFGRVGFTRKANPALRDKAGREGLVDNRAFREMQLLLTEFLVDAARKYFGTDSPIREEMMPGIMERKLAQREAADKVKAKRRKTMRQFLKDNRNSLDDALMSAANLIDLAKETLKTKDATQATVLAARAAQIRIVADNLRPPTPPSKLGDLEDQWREYRTRYQDFQQRVQEVVRTSDEVAAAIDAARPKTVLQRRLKEQAAALESQIAALSAKMESRLATLSGNWKAKRDADSKKLTERVGHLVDGNVSAGNLLGLLGLIDTTGVELSETFAADYGTIITALDNLIEGIDLQGAVDISNELREELEQQLNDIRAVAQIGITVEIIGHEFETLEAEVRRNLSKLPAAVKDGAAYKAALRAHYGLADRLRFLAPLKIGGYRSREKISGQQIADFVAEFFSARLAERKISFEASDAFRAISIIDIPSRIFPVFINLINNAIYWVTQREQRSIRMDVVDGLVVIGDSGPGVDPEDIPRLFTLFFTTRPTGRGVGLYLSRANLAVAGHKIRYATSGDPKLLGGANFIIEFKGVRTGE
jgi:signal transduction histidine kinase